MDCVSCERCRLWGKIQTIGIGTALKILAVNDEFGWEDFKLRRSEIIALFNAFGRLSESVKSITNFRDHYHALKPTNRVSYSQLLSPSKFLVLDNVSINSLFHASGIFNVLACFFNRFINYYTHSEAKKYCSNKIQTELTQTDWCVFVVHIMILVGRIITLNNVYLKKKFYLTKYTN